MHTSNKRELLSGIQYLLIGVVAEGAVLRWFGQRPATQQMLIWMAIAGTLGILRFVVLSLSEWTRRDDWQSVSRRHW